MTNKSKTRGTPPEGTELNDAVLDQVTGGVIEIKELDVVASVTGNKLLDAFLGGFYTAGGR